MRLQAWREPEVWTEGMRLEPLGVFAKDETHARHLLHRSVHLLLRDSRGRVCVRRRSDDDLRYPGLLTSTLGTHVEAGATDEGTLRALVPRLPLVFAGEFRVKDEHENKVCGLFLAQAYRHRLGAAGP